MHDVICTHLQRASHPSKSYVRLLFVLVQTWERRLRERRELASMSDRSLRDFGLSRCDALQMIRKPLLRPWEVQDICVARAR
jgi:uncharacterized protein YjiS (DUF1127 family)